MREIKFRGKRIDTGEWVYGYVLENEFKSFIIREELIRTPSTVNEPSGFETDISYYKVIPETVGQYTGIKDKNVKEIYDGDIIKFFTNFEGECIEKVFWYNEEAAFYHTYSDRPCKRFWSDNKIKIEIIGNIYKNEAILNGKD